MIRQVARTLFKICMPLFLGVSANAQSVDSLDEAIRQAVTASPTVAAAWYEFEAAREEQRVAKGGYYPDLDLYLQAGGERRDTPNAEENEYAPATERLTLTQMLFDGWATRYEVQRTNYQKLASYYDLISVSEEQAYEATRAYLDVVRYQKLVKLAEENYVEHRRIFDQIQERAGGGVSRGVDLEQASGRLALAETNLLTEMTNLHDVRARFQRIVGLLPGDALPVPELPVDRIPDDRTLTLGLAYERSPEINAAIERLRAAEAERKAQNAPMYPRLDLRLRQEIEHDIEGIEGQFDEEAIELVLNYNLYNGGSDSARKRQYYQRLNAARELRMVACRNVRQNVVIAFNDIQSLTERIEYLDANQLSINKARAAYRNQFDLGQRTLLDLLDTENEYFETKRALVNAEQDYIDAQARTLGNMGILLTSVGVDGLSDQAEDDLDLGRDDGESGRDVCPPEPPTELVIDKESLFATLMDNNDRYRQIGDNVIAIELHVEFAFDSSTITSDYDEEISNAAQFLNENPDVKAIIEGHTDWTGPEDYNQWLSDRRANRVRDAIIDMHGVNPDQIIAVGYGESRPAATNETAEGRKLNRRVDLVLDGNGVPE